MTNGVVAWCLELHDLWLAKAVAGRPKDFKFCRVLAAGGLVSANTLTTRLSLVPDLTEPVHSAVAASIVSVSQGQ